MRYLSILISLVAVLTAFPSDAKFDVDLDVTHINRTPLYPSYHGFTAYDFATGGSGEAEMKKKHQPDEGEMVTYTAHIVNKGKQTSEACSYVWRIGDKEVNGGKLGKIEPGKEVTVSAFCEWKSKRTPIEFALDAESKSGDEFDGNNQRMIYSDAWQVLVTVSKKTYDSANAAENNAGNWSFEDYIQQHVDLLNQKLADAKYPSNPEGCRARVAIDRFFVYNDDGELEEFQKDSEGLAQRMYDATYDFRIDPSNGSQSPFMSMDTTFAAEIMYQVGLVISPDIHPGQNHVTGDDGYPIRIGHKVSSSSREPSSDKWIFSELHMAALDSQVGKRQGISGDWMFAVPAKNYVQILDNIGKPIQDAIVRFYHCDGEMVANEIVFAGRTDKNGLYFLPNRQADNVTTPNGFSLKPNPFGRICPRGRRAFMLFSITARGHTEWRWLELFDLNRAWFAGKKDEAVFPYETSIGTEGAPKPPLLDGDFITDNEVYFSWHKYPNYWVNYFRLYSRALSGDDTSFGMETVDIMPYEVILQTDPKLGEWEHKLKVEEGHYEFYLTSIGDFERESSPSKVIVARTSELQGNPITVVADSEDNWIYGAEDMIFGQANTLRTNRQKRVVSVFLSPPEPGFGKVSDLILYDDWFIATFPDANVVNFYDTKGISLFALGKQGPGPGELKEPTGLAVHDGKLYVCDTGNDRIEVFSLEDGRFILEFGKTGSGPGEFKLPKGVALARDGTIAVCDSGNDRVQLFNPERGFIKELKELSNPRGITCYSDKFYIADSGNNRVLKTDKELNIIKVIDKLWQGPLKQPMDVFVHQYPPDKRRKSYATLLIAEYGSHSIVVDMVPPDELQPMPPAEEKQVKGVVAYGNQFDLDDPDTILKPLQICFYGLLEEAFIMQEWDIKLENLPNGLVIKEPEKKFFVDEYFQAVVDFEVTKGDIPDQANDTGEDFALASKGAKADGFERAELAVDGNASDYDGVDGYAEGVWKKLASDSLTVTLKKPVSINRIEILLWDKDDRYYDYTLEVSEDGKTWIAAPTISPPNVVRDIKATLRKFDPYDASDNAAHVKLDYMYGYRSTVKHEVKGTEKIKYIRITGKYNSADSGIHIVEVMAFGPKDQ